MKFKILVPCKNKNKTKKHKKKQLYFANSATFWSYLFLWKKKIYIKAERCLPVCIGPKLISEPGTNQQKKNQDFNPILTTGSTLHDDKVAENVSVKVDENDNPFTS